MASSDTSNFDVMSHDMHGEPVRCSYCSRVVPRIVILSLTRRPELEDQLSDDEGLWLGLCAKCIDGMRTALAVGAKMEGVS